MFHSDKMGVSRKLFSCIYFAKILESQ